jgi:hypothetical protein
VAATELLLFPGLKHEYCTQEGMNSALFFACGSMMSAEKVGQLLAAVADANCCNFDGKSPLYYSSLTKNIVLLLIQNGADVTALSCNGENVLRDAAFFHGPNIVRLLLEAGADVNHGNALAAAAQKGDMEGLRCLFEAGADVNASGGEDGPALHAASYHARLEAVTYLLDNDADVNLKPDISERHRCSPLCAHLDGFESASAHDVFLLLLRRGARVDVEALIGAAKNLRVRELPNILLQLDEGPRYSVTDIKAALVAVRKNGNCYRDRRRKALATRLLRMRVTPSDKGMKLVIGPEITTLTTSIYEIEREWAGDAEWGVDNEEDGSECECDDDYKGQKHSSVKGHDDVPKRIPVLRRHGTRRKCVWFVTRRRRQILEIKVLHEHV